ncbi:MAG: Selenoprotein O and cysteine-containing homologs [uncultured Sulfurovum sp.]|uniref:Protein nucleotidyltransferase YdiU n=1 Tax=uncultured Sulfurovum sp. TaxID=269237 RepID=A0A6S6T4N6_9BACT|nr:MAG: Selenoprotein O and cysteine-containing homologs [uncultured Sulfurovum sp.]
MKLQDLKLTNPYLILPKLCYNRVDPAPLNNPFLIHTNEDLAKSLGIDISDEEALTKFVNGELKLEGLDNFAMCYAGHQFGHFVPRLGDGRAINIGTLEDINKTNQHLQLKGAGQTLYSRSGDGRAVLRSSIREYLMSEAMHGLGIPTTRALGLIGSEHRVFRQTWEKGAIVLRVSPSWVRFGTFEYFSHSENYDDLKELANYAINECYPHLNEEPHKYLHFFTEVMERTAKLMAEWQAVGFNHGVMNTDNMSVLGLTIDYGPYAFLDDYDTHYICNHTDMDGRYSFGNQPRIGQWNLHALALALEPLVPKEQLDKAIEHYGRLYSQHFLRLVGKKLGFDTVSDKDFEFMTDMFTMLQSLQVDYTLFFRTLSSYDGEREGLLRLGRMHKPMNEVLDSYDKRLEENNTSVEERHAKMLAVNPKFVLKNYMLQEAIEKAEEGSFELVEALFDIAQNPYAEHEEHARWALATPDEFKNKKLSCSS